MKSISIFKRRHSPPFLLIGLVVVIVILSVNYWHASTRLADLQQQDEELRKRYLEVFLMKNQLSLKNKILETKVKENVETYDSLRQIRDKKEEEILVCKETLDAFNLGVEGLTEEMEKVLSLGLKYVPLQRVNKSQVEADLERLKIRIMWEVYWK